MSEAPAQTPHIPVLAAEAIDALAVAPGGLYLDGTFGAGGYTRLILAAGGKVLALDRDPSAIRNGAELVEASGGRLMLAQTRFSLMENAAREQKLGPFDGIVLDIGVSSMQLDEAERGFSFRFDGPLDMRMEKAGVSAADLVNELEQGPLADLIYQYGEERASRRIARAIVAERAKAPILTTGALAQIVARAAPGRPARSIRRRGRSRPCASRSTRNWVNWRGALDAAERLLRPGGRLAVVSFHSLEDRIVKQFFADAHRARPRRLRACCRARSRRRRRPFGCSGKQPVAPGAAECRQPARPLGQIALGRAHRNERSRFGHHCAEKVRAQRRMRRGALTCCA